ncbi:MAG: TetR/AcrR family transcriptional regulator [Myxococcota bacterium]
MDGRFAERARAGEEGKSARTRARLMDAAADAFARRGLEAASVAEIAQAAEVANGTFYNYFRDKDEIADAVAFAIARDFAERIDAAMRDVDDPVLRVSAGTRRFVELATREPTWGRAIVRALASMPSVRHEVTSLARRDLERGARAGAFRVAVDDLLLDLFAGMVATAVVVCLDGPGGPEVAERTAEHQLRMLGVAPARARRAARHPLAPMPPEG